MKNFKNIVIFYFLLFTCTVSYSQKTNIDIENIIVTILGEKASPEINKIFINEKMPRTYFEPEIFINESGFKNFPLNVLEELKIQSKKQSENHLWNPNLFTQISNNSSSIEYDFLNRIDFFDKNKLKELFSRSTSIDTETPLILTLYNPLITKDGKHCVITIVNHLYTGSFSAADYYLYKIYGKWIIVSRFNIIIS